MKLLGWMHRKFRQNSSEPLKDFIIGNSCNCLSGQPTVDDQLFYSKPNFKPFKQTQSSHLHPNNEEEQQSSIPMPDIFHGFLAIGTFGSDQHQLINDTNPSTPKFSISIESVTEKNQHEVTEDELKLINDELEKVLSSDSKEDGFNESSGRNSHVSLERSSHGSTVTLRGKPLEGRESNFNGSLICPLQGYLFGSAIEMSEKVTVAKREERVSLGELFQKTEVAEESSLGGECDGDEKKIEKEMDKSAINHIKRKLRKKILQSSSKSSSVNDGGVVDSVLPESKLHKIFQMFHRKVYPESSTTKRKYGKTKKSEKNKIEATFGGGNYNNIGEQKQTLSDSDQLMIYPQRKTFPKPYTTQSTPPNLMLSVNPSNKNKEHWIKTDADYLVLEL